jgi:acyl dehydratase
MIMPLVYPDILDLKTAGERFSYTERDAMLYALAIGFGADRMDERDLHFIYESQLKAVPTLATVVAWDAGLPTAQLGVDYPLVLHGEEETILHRPMPPAGSIMAESSIVEVFDKGERGGAVIVRETVLRDPDDGGLIATLRRSLLARGDGGRGGARHGPPLPHAIPGRAPDTVVAYRTMPNQAAIYRLCGDRNPLHIDPARAAAAGFDRPILHGLCTYGFTCRAVMAAFCESDPARIASHRARFSAPLFPGETLRVSLWRDGDTVSFEAEAVERAVKVIRHGKTQLR